MIKKCTNSKNTITLNNPFTLATTKYSRLSSMSF